MMRTITKTLLTLVVFGLVTVGCSEKEIWVTGSQHLDKKVTLRLNDVHTFEWSEDALSYKLQKENGEAICWVYDEKEIEKINKYLGK